MDTLTVLKFPEADGADRMIHKLEDLQKQELIQIVDAAIVSWPQGKSKPRTRQLEETTGRAGSQASKAVGGESSCV